MPVQGGDIEGNEGAGDDDIDDSLQDVLADPTQWDKETRDAWERFTVQSKTTVSKFWQYESLAPPPPKVYVDLNAAQDNV